MKKARTLGLAALLVGSMGAVMGCATGTFLPSGSAADTVFGGDGGDTDGGASGEASASLFGSSASGGEASVGDDASPGDDAYDPSYGEDASAE